MDAYNPNEIGTQFGSIVEWSRLGENEDYDATYNKVSKEFNVEQIGWNEENQGYETIQTMKGKEAKDWIKKNTYHLVAQS
jgi:hypothetical protein